MKNRFKWLLEVADQKPLLFSILLLLIAVGSLTVVIQNRDRNYQNCLEEKGVIQKYYERRLDSVISHYQIRELQLDEEVRERLNDIIMNYKSQLEEQKKLNSRINTTINENKNIIKVKNLSTDEN